MIYTIYLILFLLFLVLIKINATIEILIKMYEALKVSKNFTAGLFASLGISTLANKMDMIIYWEVEKLIALKFSILFGIIFLLVGLWLYKDK